MVNPAKFDRQWVVEQAMLLFWQRGFHATSMRHLQQAVDLRPGSLYATFGSKEGLFREALHCYAARGEALLAGFQSQYPAALDALQAFFHHTVIMQAEHAPSRICMLVKTVAELTDDNAELLADARAQINRMEQAFYRVLQQAQANGELEASADVASLAPFLQMQLMGLRAYAQSCRDPQATEQLLNQTFQSLRRSH